MCIHVQCGIIQALRSVWTSLTSMTVLCLVSFPE